MTLTTPFLWVVLPLIISGIAAGLHNRRVFAIILTSGTAFSLALMAAFLPESLTLSLGPLIVNFDENLVILGRRILIVYEIFPLITLIYGVTGLWNLGSGIQGVPKIFRPVSLVITALLTASLGVQPFLYASLFIQMAVLVSVPMLASVKSEPHVGILRYLSLQTLAMPFVLVAGWLLTGVQILPPESPLVGQTTIVLGLGFAIWLGVFPFHSWVPKVSQDSYPLAISYLLFILPTTIFVFGLNFFNRYTFLRETQNVYEMIRTIGIFMIVIGGVWTAIQNNLKRAFGFSILVETGFSLLAIGLSRQGGLTWMLLLLPMRALGYWLWGFSLSLIRSHVNLLDIRSLRGFARQFPILSLGLILAQFSVAGLPLLASFPSKIVLLSVAYDAGTALGTWAFIGNLGLFLFTLRLLAFMVIPGDANNQGWELSEKLGEFLPVLIMTFVLLILGLFPNNFFSDIIDILAAFTQLQ